MPLTKGRRRCVNQATIMHVHAEVEVAETIDYQNNHANALDNKHPEMSAVGES